MKQSIRVTSSVSTILKEEYGVGTKISIAELSKALDVHEVLLNRLMDLDNWGYMMCSKLAKVFETTEAFWWNINTTYQMTSGQSKTTPQDLENVTSLKHLL